MLLEMHMWEALESLIILVVVDLHVDCNGKSGEIRSSELYHSLFLLTALVPLQRGLASSGSFKSEQ